jgi:hypothetical protein
VATSHGLLACHQQQQQQQQQQQRTNRLKGGGDDGGYEGQDSCAGRAQKVSQQAGAPLPD